MRNTARKVTKSPIILLGGIPGVGKTTLGNTLVRELGLSHHISTGFIRAAVGSFLPEDQARLLRKQSFNADHGLSQGNIPSSIPVLQGAIAQAEILKPAIRACIARARREGIGLVLEGTHCIPGVIDPLEYDANLLGVLDVPDREELKARALSRNHTNRHLSEEELERLMLLQDHLLDMARNHGHPIIINNDLQEAVRQVQRLVGGLN